jgi:hypothetical protein
MEELDWLTTDAFRLFDARVVLSGGAGALYLKRDGTEMPKVRLEAVTESHLFTSTQSRNLAAKEARVEIGNGYANEILCDGLQGVARLDAAEKSAWGDWTGERISVKHVLGEGLMAAAAWQCVAAVQALQENEYEAALVSVVGCNQQAIAARFVAPEAVSKSK